MTRLLATTLLLTVASLCASAQGGIEWLSTSHNFGAFNEDLEKVYCVFVGVNRSAEPVSVVSARANCGCTVPTYPKEAIQPGDTLKIDVAYSAVGRPGRFSKKVYIDTSDGEKSTFTVSGTVVASQNTLNSRYPYAVGNANINNKIAMLGSTVKGRTLYGGTQIYNTGTKPIHPRTADMPDYLTAVCSPAAIPPGEAGFLSITAQTGKTEKWGSQIEHLLLYPDASAPDSIEIEVTMIINEDFSKMTPNERANAPVAKISTESIDFGHISGNKPLFATFTIANEGKTSLIIRRVESAEKNLLIECPAKKIAPGKEATVRVALNPLELPADTPLNARINFMFNDPENPHATVRVVGTH